MKKITLSFAAAAAFLGGCASTGPTSTSKPPPFECSSIYEEVCALEEQFHILRHEQAEQISAIEQAERKRKAGSTTG